MVSIVNSTPNMGEIVQASSVFERLPLEGLLPVGSVLIINHKAGILNLCDASTEKVLLAQDAFTFSEMCVTRPLFSNYPHYCPYEVLLAHFSNLPEKVTEAIIARCRQQLSDALEAGTFEDEMRPIRNVVSRARLKLHGMGITVTSMLETGYMLRPYTKARAPRRSHAAV